MAEDKAPKEKKKAEGKVKQPSAKKRDLQNEKRRLRSRSCRAEILTSIRSLEAAVSKKESPDTIKTKLSEIYSLMDKSVKKGIFKIQKAARTKSRLAARCLKA